MKNLFRTLLVALLVLGSHAAKADTLKFIFSDMPGYPFQFQVNGSNTITNLMCLDESRRVTYNETWKVDILGIPLDSSTSSVQYRAAAYVFSLIGGSYTNAVLQYAAWGTSDMATVSSNLTGAANAQTLSLTQGLVNTALQKAQDQILINSGFFSKFQLYIPTADQTGWTAGIPQRYIGAATAAVTPEPGTIVMMVTGALFMGFAVVYRKRFNSVVAGNLA